MINDETPIKPATPAPSEPAAHSSAWLNDPVYGLKASLPDFICMLAMAIAYGTRSGVLIPWLLISYCLQRERRLKRVVSPNVQAERRRP